MLQEEIVQQTDFDPSKQETKFYLNPKTGLVEIVPMDFNPDELIEVTLTEKDIQRREKEAYEKGYIAGFEDGQDTKKKK